jgi:hypothetical protein
MCLFVCQNMYVCFVFGVYVCLCVIVHVFILSFLGLECNSYIIIVSCEIYSLASLLYSLLLFFIIMYF